MNTAEPRTSTKSKRTAQVKSGRARKSKSPEKPATKPNAQASDAHEPTVTKHDRILTLLSRPGGATIQEMMEATDWQQHSVRGFLAGTVKKKLGFNLISSKSDGELRRYRTKAKRGR